MWCAGPAWLQQQIKASGGWEEADKSRPLWEGLLAQLHLRKVPTNSLLVCPALKMNQESRLGWVWWECSCQQKPNSVNGIHTLKNPRSPHINKVQLFLQAGVGIHPFHPPGFRQFSVPSFPFHLPSSQCFWHSEELGRGPWSIRGWLQDGPVTPGNCSVIPGMVL